MNKLALGVFFASLLSLVASAVPLEWNVNYDTSVPYEVELSPAKLGLKKCGFSVTADGKPLAVQTLEGKVKGTVRLRFTVPEGTKSLEWSAVKGKAPKAKKGDEVDNLFADALMGKSGWKFQGGTIESTSSGLVFVTKGNAVSATYEAEVPAESAGKPAQLEIELANVGKLAWPNNVYVEQLNASGKRLAEPVSDPRWTSHIRPAGVKTLIKECATIHPLAKKLRVVLTLSAANTQYDYHGYPLADAGMKTARLAVTRLALRPGALLPFPKYDDANFADGVSGEPGDCAIRMGGDRQTALWYQTRSYGSWAQIWGYFGDDAQMRDESLIFYPVGSGTVEAWFKPDWNPNVSVPIHLFSGAQFNVRAARKFSWDPIGLVMAVTYDPAKGELGFSKRDLDQHEAKGTAKASIPSGKWIHVALTWKDGDKATVWLDGKPALETSLAELKPLDLKHDPRPNDRDVVEAYLGANFKIARNIGAPYAAGKAPYYQGLADSWRVSSGLRYTKDFTPAKRFTVDASTRALFDFDRSFSGVSGGGIGTIPLSFYSLKDQVAHTLKVGDRTVQYYPETVLDKFEPKKVLDEVNYPVLPSEQDFHSLRKVETKTDTVKIGETMSITAPKGVYTDFIEIANESSSPLVHPLMVGNGEVDPRSFGDIRDTLFAGNALPPMERANRIFQYVINASDYFMNHSAYFPLDGGDRCGDVEYQALMMLSGYCGFECGPLNSMTKNLFVCVGDLPATQTAGYGHSFEQVFFDGKNHIYDLSAQMFFPAMDNESAAYLEEMENQPALKTRAYGNPDHFIRNGTRAVGANAVPYQGKVAMTLNPGESFRVWFDNNGEVNDLQCSHQTEGCGKYPDVFLDYTEATHANQGKNGWRVWRIPRFFPHYGNGFLRFAGQPSAANPAFNDLGNAFTYHVKSCYPIVAAEYSATLTDGTKAQLEFSTDCGKTYRRMPDGFLRYEVRARYDYFVKVCAPIAKVHEFAANTEVQVNVRVFPGRLKAGENELTLRGTGEGEAKVTVGWRSNAQSLYVKGAAYSGTIPGAETMFVAFDPTKGPVAYELAGDAAQSSLKAEVVASTLNPQPSTFNLQPSIENGQLQLSAPADAKGFATVRLSSGALERYLTVLVGKGVRFATTDIHLHKTGDEASGKLDAVSAGKYAVLWLSRVPAHLPLDKRGGARLTLSIGGKNFACGRPVNCGCNFYKAMYGREGQRGAWHWDYVNRPDIRYYLEMADIPELAATDSFKLSHTSSQPYQGGVEFGALLLVPTPERELYEDLVKILCGLNTQKGKVK